MPNSSAQYLSSIPGTCSLNSDKLKFVLVVLIYAKKTVFLWVLMPSVERGR